MNRQDDLRRLTRAWNDAWNSRDASKLAAFFSDDATYFEPSMSEPEPGRLGIVAAAEKTWTDWPHVTFEEVSQTIEEPRVVLEWRSTARHRSGKVVELQGVDILEWTGDKLGAARVYYDEHHRKEILGE